MERKFMPKCLGKAREIVQFFGKSGKGWPFGHWKFRKFKPEWKAPLGFAFIIIVIFDVIIFTDRESENENNHEFCATQYFITVVGRIKLFNTKNCNKPRGYSRSSVAEWLGHPPEEVAGSSPALST